MQARADGWSPRPSWPGLLLAPFGIEIRGRESDLNIGRFYVSCFPADWKSYA